MLRKLVSMRLILFSRPCWRFFSGLSHDQISSKLQSVSRLMVQSKSAQALKQLQELKGDMGPQFQNTHIYWPTLQACIGGCLYEVQRYSEAEQVFKELCEYHGSQNIDLQLASNENKNKVVYSWIYYGRCLFQKNEVDAAITVTKKGLQLMEQGYGCNNPHTLDQYAQLAKMLQLHQRYDLCLEYLKICVERREQVVGSNDYHVVRQKLIMAEIKEDLGRYEQIVPELLTIIEACGENDKFQKMKFNAKFNLSQAYKELKQHSESLVLLKELEKVMEGPLNEHSFKLKRHLAQALLATGNQDECIQFLKNLIQEGVQNKLDSTVDFIQARMYYSDMLNYKKRPKEAAQQMKAAYESSKKIFGEDSGQLLFCLNHYILHLTFAEEYEEAHQQLEKVKSMVERRKTQPVAYCYLMMGVCQSYGSMKSHSHFANEIEKLKEFMKASHMNEAQRKEIEKKIKDLEEQFFT